MEKDIITLEMPAKPEYVMVIRLTSAAIAGRKGFNIDQIEDIKMSVAEAIIMIINQGIKPENLKIKFTTEAEKIDIEIRGEGEWKKDTTSTLDSEQAQLGKFILNSMMDKVEFKVEDGLMHAVAMHKECGV